MQRLIEFILGLEPGALGQQGEYSLTFDPIWPGQSYFPAAAWNLLLLALIATWVWYIYRHEEGKASLRRLAGAMRFTALLLILALLNRPMLSLTRTRTEPSVLALALDDSLSMQVADEKSAPDPNPAPRLASAKSLLTADNGALLSDLAARHHLRLYRFSTAPQLLASIDAPSDLPPALKAIQPVKPAGQSTHLHSSIQQIARQLQGQRLAGIVLLTDGHEMPALAADPLEQLPTVRLYPLPLGSEARAKNIAIQSVASQDVIFKGDLAAIAVRVSVTGLDRDQPITLTLQRPDGTTLPGLGSADAKTILRPPGDGVFDADIVFPAKEAGTLNLQVLAQSVPGEITTDDNSRPVQLSVVDSQINLLYVDGNPRWEYRYIKTQLIRDKSIQISTLLTSAQVDYAQEGDRPIRFFPTTMDQLLDYDVLLLGDVDPRQFTDAQLVMIRDFVMKKGGGFGMIAGPRFSPQAWRGTPIENILPVEVQPAHSDDPASEPFRPALTAEGQGSPIFRFFADRLANEKYIRESLPPLYWFAQGVSARPGIAETYAEHPSISGPDGRKAPLLVVGRPGAGRSLFSAIDDSWRWRYYTGESIFDTYWVQQVRYLARGRKAGQRRIAFTTLQPAYEVGEQTQLELRVIDDLLASQLPDALDVELYDNAGKLLNHSALQRQGTRKDVFRALLPASETGRFTARLPSIAPGIDPAQSTFDVIVPRLELSDPSPARSLLSQYAGRTDGKLIDLAQSRDQLLSIPSAARMVPVQTAWRLWSSPFLLGLLVLLLAVEWILRKFAGLI